MSDTSDNAALSLQQIIEEERNKRIEAENTAKAIIEEFTSCSDFDDFRKKFKEKIKEIAPQALTNIINLANNSESDSVRAAMNKWLIEWAMSDRLDEGKGELSSLLKQLAKNDSKNPVG